MSEIDKQHNTVSHSEAVVHREIQLPSMSAFLAGAAAGAASRTVVSPIERLKIIYQVQPEAQYQGIVASLVKMYREEGLRGYMRGNGVNVLRIAPYSAVQFSSYELFKSVFSPDGNVDTLTRLLAGSLAGVCSVVSTYPLDLVRSRLSIESASLGLQGQMDPRKSTGIVKMTQKVYREEGGMRGLFRGLVPTSLGVAPYVALNFASYEYIKKFLADKNGYEPSTFVRLMIGGISGSISQTLTYPLDVLRRRFQVIGMKDLGYEYNSTLGALRSIIKHEGIKGLYKGCLPNIMKVGPAMGTSFAVYDLTKSFLDDYV